MPMTLAVISPHLDDAALSCSLHLAGYPGSHIVTIFAGGPARVTRLTDWDQSGRYFHDGDDVVGVRRQEDDDSASLMSSVTHHLDYWDEPYRSAEYGYEGAPGDITAEHIADELVSVAAGIDTDAWLIPLGLGHVDHRLAGAASLLFARRHSGAHFVYFELPYYVEVNREVTGAVQHLQATGARLVDDGSLRPSGDRSLKEAAIGCHVSQLRSIGRRRLRRALRHPERVLRLDLTGAH